MEIKNMSKYYFTLKYKESDFDDIKDSNVYYMLKDYFLPNEIKQIFHDNKNKEGEILVSFDEKEKNVNDLKNFYNEILLNNSLKLDFYKTEVFNQGEEQANENHPVDIFCEYNITLGIGKKEDEEELKQRLENFIKRAKIYGFEGDFFIEKDINDSDTYYGNLPISMQGNGLVYSGLVGYTPLNQDDYFNFKFYLNVLLKTKEYFIDEKNKGYVELIYEQGKHIKNKNELMSDLQQIIKNNEKQNKFDDLKELLDKEEKLMLELKEIRRRVNELKISNS